MHKIIRVAAMAQSVVVSAEQIAKATKVFIVGHTDMQGPVERNRILSRDRAAAVIAALVKDHGITVDRLTAEGVGPLAPAASNVDEAGRAKNRRVEMVLR